MNFLTVILKVLAVTAGCGLIVYYTGIYLGDSPQACSTRAFFTVIAVFVGGLIRYWKSLKRP